MTTDSKMERDTRRLLGFNCALILQHLEGILDQEHVNHILTPNLGTVSHGQLDCARCNRIQKPCVRNSPAANCCCQFPSLSHSLLDNLIKGVWITSLWRLHAVNDQGCAREISLVQDRSPCHGNQIFKMNLVCRHEVATEVEGQPCKQIWCLENKKCIQSIFHED